MKKKKFSYCKDDEGIRRRVYRHHGFNGYWTRWTQACSGCHETIDGYESGNMWDDKLKCYIGWGCSECGYTGKRRIEWFVPFNQKGFEAYCDRMYEKERYKG